MSAPLTITLPIPSRSLWPNTCCHWHHKAKVTKKHRWRAHMLARVALNAKPRKFSGYTLAFHYPDKRRRDDDNAAASCKAYRDGIADALGVDDNTLRLIAIPTFHLDRTNPRLEITLIP